MKCASPPYLFEDLPDELPLFPLSGVVLLPRGQLPLNIFEPRYLNMFNDALKGNRIIGMIQPRNICAGPTADNERLFDTGCAGRITAFEEIASDRYMVTLTGLCRFKIAKELPLENGYRQAIPNWSSYACDIEKDHDNDFDRTRLETLLRDYLLFHNMDCDWQMIDNTCNEKLITILAMICPLDHGEKQALLEAGCCCNRANLFMDMIEMAMHGERVAGYSVLAH